jgi:hypothetical protein
MMHDVKYSVGCMMLIFEALVLFPILVSLVLMPFDGHDAFPAIKEFAQPLLQ